MTDSWGAYVSWKLPTLQRAKAGQVGSCHLFLTFSGSALCCSILQHSNKILYFPSEKSRSGRPAFSGAVGGLYIAAGFAPWSIPQLVDSSGIVSLGTAVATLWRNEMSCVPWPAGTNAVKRRQGQ
jgi:hypothetical protein